jgi:hypothetical protein
LLTPESHLPRPVYCACLLCYTNVLHLTAAADNIQGPQGAHTHIKWCNHTIRCWRRARSASATCPSPPTAEPELTQLQQVGAQVRAAGMQHTVHAQPASLLNMIMVLSLQMSRCLPTACTMLVTSWPDSPIPQQHPSCPHHSPLPCHLCQQEAVRSSSSSE